MKYRVTWLKTNPAIAARNAELREEEARTGWHAQGAMKCETQVGSRIVCGDQDDVDRFVNEHLSEARNVTVTPLGQ